MRGLLQRPQHCVDLTAFRLSFGSSVSGHPVSIWDKQGHQHGIEFVEEHHHHIPGPPFRYPLLFEASTRRRTHRTATSPTPKHISKPLPTSLIGQREDRGDTPHADAWEDRLELEVAFLPLLQAKRSPPRLQTSWKKDHRSSNKAGPEEPEVNAKS